MNSLHIALCTLKRTLREPGMVGMMLVLPFLGAILAMVMFGEPAPLKVGIAGVDARESALVKALEETGNYKLIFLKEEELEDSIRDKKIHTGLVIPASVAPAKIKILSLKEDDKVIALKAVVSGHRHYETTGQGYKTASGVDFSAAMLNKPRTAMGMLIMFMMLFIGTGMGMILEEKRNRTFMRQFCAPLREHEVVLGKLAANFVLGTVQIVVFLLAGKFVLGIDWGVSLVHMFLVLFTFLITAVGLGIGLTGFIQSSQVLSVVNSILATMTCMLGGCFFSTSLMNGPLRVIANLIPQKWAMEAFEKLYTGGSPADIGTHLLILLLFGAVFFTFGMRTLRPAASDL